MTILATHPKTILPVHRVDIGIPASEPGGDAQGLPQTTLRRKIGKRELRHLEEVQNVAGELGRLPERDESIHAIMRQNFHAWDLCPAILQLASPATIDELIVATLGFNVRNANELLKLLDEQRVRSVVFLCSHYFAKASSAEYEILRSGLEHRGQKVAAQRTHAKVIGAKLTDGRCVVVEMSANLRSCHNVEQIAVTESPELFAFHKKWIEEVSAWTPPKGK